MSDESVFFLILCLVSISFNLKVAWMHFEQSAILTVHNHVITRNPRITVTHDKHDKYKTWFLHISNVQEEDKGRYMCQINTVTAKTQFGYVHVVGEFSLNLKLVKRWADVWFRFDENDEHNLSTLMTQKSSN